MSWDSEPFYQKSKLYLHKARELEPEDRFYVFWHLLAYEFLFKSCVAANAKPLLADPRTPQNLLFALGVEIAKVPQQRQFNELLEIGKSLIDGFTDEDYKKSLTWAGFRNEELHSASDRLSEIAETGWLGDYYRISKILLSYLGKTVSDYYGKDHANAVEKVVAELKTELIAEVKKEIAAAKSYYKKMSAMEVSNVKKLFKRPHVTKVAKCPSCDENFAVITGERIKTSEPALDGEDLYSISTYLPSAVRCAMCRFELNGYSSINTAGLGAEFSVKRYLDPIEQFNIDVEEVFKDMYPDKYLQEDEYMDE